MTAGQGGKGLKRAGIILLVILLGINTPLTVLAAGPGSAEGQKTEAGAASGIEEGQETEPGAGSGIEEGQETEPGAGPGIEEGQETEPGAAPDSEEGQETEPGAGSDIEEGQETEPGAAPDGEEGQETEPGAAPDGEEGQETEHGAAPDGEEGQETEPGAGSGGEEGQEQAIDPEEDGGPKEPGEAEDSLDHRQPLLPHWGRENALLYKEEELLPEDGEEMEGEWIREEGIQVNPVYQSVVDEEVLAAQLCQAPAEAALTEAEDYGARAGEQICNSVQEAGSFLKEKMLRQEETVQFTYLAEKLSGIQNTIFDMVYMEATRDELTGPVGEGDYLWASLLGYEWKSSYQYDAANSRYIVKVTLQFTYLTNAEQEAYITQNVSRILASLPLSGRTEPEKAWILYRYVCDHVDYVSADVYDPVIEDVVSQENSGKRIYHTAYGALTQQAAVCQGFAILYYRLCKEAGIPVRFVVSSNHAWNIVRLDGVWYNVDPTWDGERAVTTYTWFLKDMLDFEGHTRESLSIRKLPGDEFPMAEASYGRIPLRLEGLTEGEVRIGWDSAYGAGGYLLERRKKGESDYTMLADMPGSQEAYTDTTAEPGYTYEYRLRAYLQDGSERLYLKAAEDLTVVNGKRSMEETSVSRIVSQVYTGGSLRPKVTVKDGAKLLEKGKDYRISYENNVDVGTGTAVLTGIGNYQGARRVPFAIKYRDIRETRIEGLQACVTYTGQYIFQDLAVKRGYRELLEGRDYRITYLANRSIGKATIRLQGIGNYTGRTEKTFTIKPEAPKVVQAVSNQAGTIQVSWKKTPGATGYQVQYAKDAAFTKEAYRSTFNGGGSLRGLLKGKKTGEAYYIRARAMGGSDENRVYGPYSQVYRVVVR